MFKSYVREQFRRLFRRMQSVEDRLKDSQARRIHEQRCNVYDFKTGLMVMRANAVPVLVYGEKRQLFVTPELNEKRWAVDMDLRRHLPGCGVMVVGHGTMDGSNDVPSDLRKYLSVIQPNLHAGSVRWYRRGEEPKCDFIDASGPKDRFITLVGKESKR